MYLLVTCLLFGNIFISIHANYYKDGEGSTDGDTMSLVRSFLAKHRGGSRFQTSHFGAQDEAQNPYLLSPRDVSSTAGPVYHILSPQPINQKTIPYFMEDHDSSSIAVGTRNLGRKRAINGSKTETNQKSSISLKPETHATTLINSTNLDEQGSNNQENKTINKPIDKINSNGKPLKTNVFDINDVKKMLNDYKIQARSGVQLTNSSQPNLQVMLDKLKSKQNLTKEGNQSVKLNNMTISDEKPESPTKLVNKLKEESNLTSDAELFILKGGLKSRSGKDITVRADVPIKLPSNLEDVATGEPNIVLSGEKANIIPRTLQNISVTFPDLNLNKTISITGLKSTASDIHTSNQFSPRSSNTFATDFSLAKHPPSSSSNSLRENVLAPTNNFLSSYFEQDKPSSAITASPAYSRARSQQSSVSNNNRDNFLTWKPSTHNFPSSVVVQAKSIGEGNGCNVEGRFLLVGDKWLEPGVCGLFTCEPNSFRTVSTACPTLMYQEGSGCTIKEQDMNLDFPRCCPILSCPIYEK
ncbi:uncharacterized protein LOC124359164 isoform X2 [Homalodisca vitripennis]|uniref:uncharacterized protein LOC124359164 isoform X2 n=1 Tax=Homalodisca vitripennis TaxID=197043 RepID=UPI001EECDE18|nr:uncharacterized protein LOC124359164 isoform X2 [Homalodisca vitripennis]